MSLESMRRCTSLLAIAVAAATTTTAFTLPPRVPADSAPRSPPPPSRADTVSRVPGGTPRLHAQPDSDERRELDPVIGKAIVEKSGFFAAAIVLAILFEKLT